MIIYNSTWSILIQQIRIILSGDNLTSKIQKKAYFMFAINVFTRSKKIYRIERSLKICGTMHYLVNSIKHQHFQAQTLRTLRTIFFISSSGDWNSRMRINMTSLVQQLAYSASIRGIRYPMAFRNAARPWSGGSKVELIGTRTECTFLIN